MNIDRWLENNGLQRLEGWDRQSAKIIGEYAHKVELTTPINITTGIYNAMRCVHEENMILIRQNNRIERLLMIIAKNTEKS